MKFSILALGAAVAGITTQCAAQIQIESPQTNRNPQTRLVSQNQDFFGSAAQTGDESTNSDDSAYYSDSTPKAEIENAADAQLGPRSVLETPIADEVSGASPSKPVSTNAPLQVLAMTPEVGMVPVCWQNAGCPTPNPVASYMVRNWCTGGLWDTYPCEKAKQCAHIQQHIHGYNRYTGVCSSCAPVGVVGRCASGNCAPAPTDCAQNTSAPKQQTAPVSGLAANAPAATSPFIGELQAGLPVIDFSQLPASHVQMTAYGSEFPGATMSVPTMPLLPSGQPLLQLPADVPTVPAGAVPSSSVPTATTPGLQPALPGVLPSVPLPNATPVVASRPSASLR